MCDLLAGIPAVTLAANYECYQVADAKPAGSSSAGVVHRYLFDMDRAFTNIRDLLEKRVGSSWFVAITSLVEFEYGRGKCYDRCWNSGLYSA